MSCCFDIGLFKKVDFDVFFVENCFSDIDNFLLTQVNDEIASNSS